MKYLRESVKVMGIVNVTPDSFSDGGRYFQPEEAIRRVRNLARAGADIVDLGAESTRPGATPIVWSEEWSRLEPVLKGVDTTRLCLSVDTYHPETAERAIAAGVRILNCVRPDAAPAMLRFLRKHPQLEAVVPAKVEVPAELLPRVYLDPMIGFGTTREEDLALLRSLCALAASGRVLLGVSRKRIVRKLIAEGDDRAAKKIGNGVGKLLGGNLALAIWAMQNGVSCLRVHDVAETVQALRVFGQLSG